MKILHGGTGRRIRGKNSNEQPLVSTSDREVTHGGTTSEITVSDVVKNQHISGTTDYVFSIYKPDGVECVNLTPELCDIAGADVDHIADGNVKIRIGDKLVSKNIRSIINSVSHSFNRFVAGSMAEAASSEIGALGLLQTPNASQITVNSNTDHIPFTRNDANILSANYDTSFVGYSPTFYGDIKVGTIGVAISPNHCLTADHVMGGEAEYTFVDTLGNYHTRLGRNWRSGTGIARNVALSDQDIGIMYFDTPLPPEVNIAKILPVDWRNKLPNRSVSGEEGYVPTFVIRNNTTEVGLRGLVHNPFSPTTKVSVIMNGDFSEWHRGGASGSAILLPINGQLVAVSSFHTQADNWTYLNGPDWSQYITEINAEMTALHGGSEHQLQTIDLSAFLTF